MHLHHGPFRWPWRCAGAIWSASPDASWPGLHQKSLDAAIGGLLAPYCLGDRQGNNRHNNNATCTHFAGRFDGHRHVAVLYCTHRPVAFIKANKLQHRALTRSDITPSDTPTLVFWHQEGLQQCEPVPDALDCSTPLDEGKSICLQPLLPPEHSLRPRQTWQTPL